jgi:acyl carrier protein
VSPDAIRESVVAALCQVAPEIDPATLDPAAELRGTLDLDSMDFLNFVTALHKALQVDIPESDYRRLATLDACVAYLAARLA